MECGGFTWFISTSYLTLTYHCEQGIFSSHSLFIIVFEQQINVTVLESVLELKLNNSLWIQPKKTASLDVSGFPKFLNIGFFWLLLSCCLVWAFFFFSLKHLENCPSSGAFPWRGPHTLLLNVPKGWWFWDIYHFLVVRLTWGL